MRYDMIKLKELCTVNQGLQIPISKRYKEPRKNRYFYITVQFLKDSGENYYIENPPKNVICTVDEILVVRTGNTGQVITGVAGCFHNNFFKVTPNEKVFPRYLYYALNNKKMHDAMLNAASGTTIPDLKHSSFYNLVIPLPEISIQKKIAKILDNICDKLKLNNEINNNLFELLKQEFRKKFYTKEGEKSYLIDYISKTIGGDWGKESPEGNNNTRVYCVRGADIPSMEYGNKGNAPIRYILEKNYKNKKLDPNDIIIEISGGSPTQSTGRTAYITKSILDMYNSPLLCTNFCRAIESKSDILAPFVYMNLKLMYEDDIFFNWENGTTGIKNLALNDMLSNLEVKSPNEIDLEDFYLLFNNIMNKISNNSNENIKLQKLMDTLLPKLMNGEIKLENIEI